MKKFVVFVIIIGVSQHAMAGVVEEFKGAESVLLPCQYLQFIPEDPTVMWTRNDLNPKFVLLQRHEKDDHQVQNQGYRGRTSMSPDALDTGEFSLTLKKPQLSDNGKYTCTISDGRDERKVADVQLQVKDDQVEVPVKEGSTSVVLPCIIKAPLPVDTVVEWTRTDPKVMIVHVYSNSSADNKKQDEHYCGRTKMNEDLLKSGDLSLTLQYPTQRDGGAYICTVHTAKDVLKQKVMLRIRDRFPLWAGVLVAVSILLLIVTGSLLFLFRHYFMSVYQVQVHSGVQSVQLHCKTRVHLPEDVKVEWRDRDNRKVHVYQNGSDLPEEQDWFYKDQTEMVSHTLQRGNLSLTLKYPRDRDSGIYTCTVYSKDGDVLMKKQVLLHVIVPQVEVDSGEESVELPYKTRVHLPEDATVEWTHSYRKVHVYKNGSDWLEEQDQFYRNRTSMNEDPLKNRDLSLTLKYPIHKDKYTHTCTIYSKDGDVLMKKQVQLYVRVPQVEVKSGTESIKLLSTAKDPLPEDGTVEWTDSSMYKRKVHVYQSGYDKPKEQMQLYKDHTRMDKDLLITGDLSLTLRYPIFRHSNTYTCTVYKRDGDILMRKQVKLNVRVPKVEVDSGAESVELLCKSTGQIHKDFTVVWMVSYRNVHVYQNGSDQPVEQDPVYRNRTEMNKDGAESEDLSLTLKYPRETDNGMYTCTVYSKEGDMLMKKQVELYIKVPKVQVESGTESFQLQFQTTADLPEDVRVEWWYFQFRKVHVYQNGSNQNEDQDPFYRGKTSMEDNPLETGDLSVTLKNLKTEHSGRYRCEVYDKEGNIIRAKSVQLEVKDRSKVQYQANDIRSKDSSTDQTPLMDEHRV